MLLTCFFCSLSLGEIESFFGGTYPDFLPSNTVFMALSFGMIGSVIRRASVAKRDFEIAERVHLERAPRVHDYRRVGGFDDRWTGDAIARRQQSAIVNRCRQRASEVCPVDASFPQARSGFDARARRGRLGQARARRGRRSPQPQGHDFLPRFAV